ncbi:MAG TPA: hypothetical protein DIS90_02900, partial [Cytophagales bacterium]|nr:hypothetical protein [Cytophagales bacterium]
MSQEIDVQTSSPNLHKYDYELYRDRQKQLCFRLLLFQFIICIGYFVYVVIILNTPLTQTFLPLFVVATLFALFLWKIGRYSWAVIFNLSALNILLFLISERLTTNTGIDLYYVAIGAEALVLFGYEQRKAGVGFALFSILLFLLTRFLDFEAIPPKVYSQNEESIFFAINSIASFSISIYCVVMLMTVNNQTQKKLQQITMTAEAQNAELQKTNKELDRFVYSASHDLKSPLSSIKGLIHIMEIGEESERQECMAKIKQRVNAMDDFLKDLTTYSRNSRLVVSFEFVLLKQVVKELLASFESSKEANKINFQIEIKDDFVVKADAYRLKVVLTNLIANAIKYADFAKAQPKVTIKAYKKNEDAIIQVVDNGIGIASEHLGKVFNMFYRATEKSSGSGLGLY